jgi:hypothetical protein
MLFVLYKNSGVHSGRALRKQLAELYDGKVLGGYPNRFAGICKREGEPEYVINLGTTEEYPKLGSTFLNEREMVRTASNKKAARRTFEEQGIPAPKLFLRGSDVDIFPAIGRTSYHSKGQGFWFCKDKRDVSRAVKAGATHFMEFVPNTREYRVHTFIKAKAMENDERKPEDYVSVKISEKVWQGEGQPDPEEPQKNHEFGWTFLGPQNRREEELDVVRNVAKQAIASLEMDFGAVDVMYRVKNKRPYVLEVNSTPSLSDDNADTCERYANRILKTLGKLKEE